MAGTPLNQFTQLLAATGPAWASGAEQFVMDAGRSTYVWGRFTTGKDRMEMIQSGDEIRDRIFLEYARTFQRYSPNPTFTPTMPQTGVEWTMDWAFATAWISVTKHELGLNKEAHTNKYRSARFKSVLKQKHQNLRVDVMEGLDDECAGNLPDFSEMESGAPVGPRIPYCIHALINEYDNGTTNVYTATATGNAPLVGGLQGAGLIPSFIDNSTTDWTQVQRIDPRAAGRENWRPYQNHYGSYFGGTAMTADDALAATELFAALSRAFWHTDIERLPKWPEQSDKRTMPTFILCSIEGVAYFEQVLRANQDQFLGVARAAGQDPDYKGATFRGIPFEASHAMGAVPLYANTGETAGVTELDATAQFAGPRYILANGNYMLPFVHSENYCVMDDPLRSVQQPFTWVQYMDLWNNFGVRSRRRNGHLRPGPALA